MINLINRKNTMNIYFMLDLAMRLGSFLTN